MVNPNRVEVLRVPRGSLIASAGSQIDIYTHRPIVGFLQGIQFVAGDWSGSGNLTVTVSGTGEALWSMESGTDTHNVTETFTVYPRATTVSTTNISLSGTNTAWFTEIPLSSILHVVGSQLGSSTAGKTGSELNFIYRI